MKRFDIIEERVGQIINNWKNSRFLLQSFRLQLFEFDLSFEYYVI